MDVRKIFYYLFSGRWFLCERLFFPSRFLFFKYVTWRFSPCGRIFLFFCLDTKEKETKRKNQGYVSGPTPERPFWRWKMNSLRCTTLRQHFSAPPVHSHAHAPTPRPIFFHAKALRCWLFVVVVCDGGGYHSLCHQCIAKVYHAITSATPWKGNSKKH